MPATVSAAGAEEGQGVSRVSSTHSQQLRGAVAPLQDALRSLEYTPKLNWNSDSNAIQEIQSVKISVAPTKEIISIQSRAQRGNIEGSFILLVDQSEYGLGARKTKPVFTNATADDMQLAISGGTAL